MTIRRLQPYVLGEGWDEMVEVVEGKAEMAERMK